MRLIIGLILGGIYCCSLAKGVIVDPQTQASQAFSSLQQFYDTSSNSPDAIWGFDTSTNLSFWEEGNAIEAIANYSLYNRSQAVCLAANIIFQHVATLVTLNVITENPYYDDEGWWGLGWLRAYQATHNHQYLNLAEQIYAHIKTQAWDQTCGGGVWWNNQKKYKNAITNELYMMLAIKLYKATGDHSYLHDFNKEYSWFTHSGLINNDGQINDGLTATCTNNGQTTWSYNQGVILGALTAAYKLTTKQHYLDLAEKIATQAIANLSMNGILTESCERTDYNCNTDQRIFKGIFIRYLGYLAHNIKSTQPIYSAYLSEQSSEIWNHSRDSTNRFMVSWTGQPNTAITASAQLQALDAFDAEATSPH